MNRLQNLATPRPLIVTLNPEIEPMQVHDEASFAHPQFDAAAIAAQGRLAGIQGRGGVHYAGAWTRYGFHEDGAESGLAVGQALGGDVPWELIRRVDRPASIVTETARAKELV